ncbi:hypothetical protein [Chryseobacterium populi]|uniref:Uncharacterized protein n=1 Tax=Chryseobacterium populi TaxID=1144316 RepID=J3CGX3_9FLAO|nr:hypothetical protein [Chryseobacterium populi]EJL71439.1 hypothetical protein PMI13_02387 [Chryseobacterium populi]
MKIHEIRDQIAKKLSNDYNTWHNLLNHTQPESYTCGHWKVEINPTDIWVDVPTRTFSVNDGFFSSNVIPEPGNNIQEVSYNKAFTAKGKFELDQENDLKLEKIDIDIEIDIF